MPRKGKAKPDSSQAKLGKRVRELRERAGLSQYDLSVASGVSRVYLGTVERAEKGASIEVIEKLARGLNVEPYELLQFDGSRAAESSPPARLGRKVASLALGSGISRLDRFERIAKAFFEADDETHGSAVVERAALKRPRGRRTGRGARRVARPR